MAWLEFLLPLVFLTPLGAAMLVAIMLGNMHAQPLQSPSTGKPILEMAQQHRDRLRRAQSRFSLICVLAPTLTLAPVVYGMGRMLVADEQSWLEWSIYGMLSTLVALVFAILIINNIQRMRRLSLALACEVSVGQTLDLLIRPQAKPYFVIHDFPTAQGLVDNVLVTPKGLYVIHTLARDFPLDLKGKPRKEVFAEAARLRFPDWNEREPIVALQQNTQWLHDWLAETEFLDVPVKGILVLPGWEISDEAEAHQRDKMIILNNADLAEELSDLQTSSLADSKLQQLVSALTARKAESAS